MLERTIPVFDVSPTLDPPVLLARGCEGADGRKKAEIGEISRGHLYEGQRIRRTLAARYINFRLIFLFTIYRAAFSLYLTLYFI